MSFNDFMPAGNGYGWMLDGECVNYPGEMFFPQDDDTAVVALTVCASCGDGVKRRCLEFALVHAEHGVWGGMSEDQRRDLKMELKDAKEQTYET